jgi:superfamily II DNA or RNA helicase
VIKRRIVQETSARANAVDSPVSQVDPRPSGRLPRARLEHVQPRLTLFFGDVEVYEAGRCDTRELALARLEFGRPIDPSAEEHARQILESFGLLDLSCLDDFTPDEPADYLLRTDTDAHELCAFGAYAVPQLEALGFSVDLEDSYPYRIVKGAPVFYAELDDDEERPNWFAMELGVDVSGRRLNLLPALVDLLEGADGIESLVRKVHRNVALQTDGGHVVLPGERVQALVRILQELYRDRLGKLKDGKAAFAKQDMPRLADLVELLSGEQPSFELEGDPKWVKLAQKATRRIDPESVQPKMLKAELRSYQKEGVAWMQQHVARGTGAVLADDMGLGKTLQTIAHLCLEREKGALFGAPALIVAPTSLVGNWVREFKKFAPTMRLVTLESGDRTQAWQEVARADVVIASYAVLLRDEEQFGRQQFHIVALDEAQTIKNDKSRAHAAVRTVPSRHRLCLTGTPVENHLGELWSLVDFLNPGMLGDEVSFARSFRVPIEKLGNEERLADLRKILAPYILRRVKSEVAKELPPKTEIALPIELKGPQRDLYESIRVAAHADVRSLIKKKGLAGSTLSILSALTKLRQVCCDPRLVDLESARKVEASVKTQALFELLHKQLGEGHRVLIFSQFTSMLELVAQGLRDKGIGFVKLTGSTADRQALVEQFEAGLVPIFLISLKAGGTGLTLTSADTVIHFDPWWNPAAQAQATDRAYRIGQKKPVFVYSLFVAGSVEERMLKLQRKKSAVADAILGAGAAGGALTEEDVEVLFAPLE